jgi:hypothetical protein
MHECPILVVPPAYTRLTREPAAGHGAVLKVAQDKYHDMNILTGIGGHHGL